MKPTGKGCIYKGCIYMTEPRQGRGVILLSPCSAGSSTKVKPTGRRARTSAPKAWSEDTWSLRHN